MTPLKKNFPNSSDFQKSIPGGRVEAVVMASEKMTEDDLKMGRRILDLPMGRNDADAATVRGYLVKLLAEVWKYDECFDGKRPFGNSGWKWELYQALEDAKLTDDDDRAKSERLIHLAIKAMAEVSK